jgi:RNA polymerase sigma-70 factor, ECF subfamily
MEDPDAELLTRLRAGDEAAFMELVDRYGPLMLRIAMSHVPTRAIAEDVVGEAWLGVLQGLPRFEGRSSLKTWILRIVTNRARTRGVRERRSVPLSSLEEATVDPERFAANGAWSDPPEAWQPEQRLLERETLAKVREAVGQLPPRQQEVILLRDFAGWEPEEVSQALDISDGNQRVLLHRARAKVRTELERYLS